MLKVVISGTGVYTPPATITNAELVESFNKYVQEFNAQHAAEITAGSVEPLEESSVAFIEKASGIKKRHVMDKQGVLNTATMHPVLEERSNDENSILCEMAVAAAKQAMAAANRTPQDIDHVIVACSNLQRAYPAISIEVQGALGIEGYAFDMNVACSSATFGLQNAASAIQSGAAKCVLIVNPEICSAHLNFRDRDSHFIFGDVCTAIIIESAETATSNNCFEIVDINLKTQFSNNIRNNFGFLNRTAPGSKNTTDKLFMQQGRKVFKEVSPMVAELITAQLSRLQTESSQIKRLWLHQANLNMNQLIAKKVLGREASENDAPTILDEYANTSSAGSIIAFHQHSQDFAAGDLGVLCSFGAGYSAGSIVLKKRA